MARRQELEERLALPETASDPSLMEKLGREYNAINKNMPVFNKYVSLINVIEEAKEILKVESDDEMVTLANQELAEAESKFPN